jgi:AraC-like DNA-binding protein
MRRKLLSDDLSVVTSHASKTPIGAILRHGVITDSPGPTEGRRLKHFCLVYTLRGQTTYEDARIGKCVLKAGDLLLIHPGVAHLYGNGQAGGWDEYFLVFDGPLFDLWEKKGLLNPRKPIVHLEPIPYWHRRLAACVEPAESPGIAGTLKQLVDLLAFLTETMEMREIAHQKPRQSWLSRACRRLGSNFGEPIDWPGFSRELGLSPQMFRKLFKQVMGVSPGKYRAAKIIDRACQLSVKENKLGKEIARELGFATEPHFSRRFKEVTGMTMSQFRAQWGSSGETRALPK